jgi:hypothetical protein
MRIIIPSRRRVALCGKALKLFPSAAVCVDEAEAEDYAVLDAEIITHPSSVAGIGPLRQWILDNVTEETVFMVDDDVSHLRMNAGRTTAAATVVDPEIALQMVKNAARIARGLGTCVFGFSQHSGDVRKFHPQNPFSLNNWVGGAIGIIGRELRYDTSLKLRADIDYCLQALLKYRCVFVDERCAMMHQRFNNTGGNAHMRSGERNERELAYLKNKWGQHLEIRRSKKGLNLSIRVQRTQRVMIVS